MRSFSEKSMLLEDIAPIVSSVVKSLSLSEITENSNDKQRCFENFQSLKQKKEFLKNGILKNFWKIPRKTTVLEPLFQ